MEPKPNAFPFGLIKAFVIVVVVVVVIKFGFVNVFPNALPKPLPKGFVFVFCFYVFLAMFEVTFYVCLFFNMGFVTEEEEGEGVEEGGVDWFVGEGWGKKWFGRGEVVGWNGEELGGVGGLVGGFNFEEVPMASTLGEPKIFVEDVGFVKGLL